MKKIDKNLVKKDTLSIALKIGMWIIAAVIFVPLFINYNIELQYAMLLGADTGMALVKVFSLIFIPTVLLTLGHFFVNYKIWGKDDDGVAGGVMWWGIFTIFWFLFLLFTSAVFGNSKGLENVTYGDGTYTFNHNVNVKVKSVAELNVRFKASHEGNLMPNEAVLIPKNLKPITEIVKNTVEMTYYGKDAKYDNVFEASDTEGRKWKVKIVDVTVLKDISPVK